MPPVIVMIPTVVLPLNQPLRSFPTRNRFALIDRLDILERIEAQVAVVALHQNK